MMAGALSPRDERFSGETRESIVHEFDDRNSSLPGERDSLNQFQPKKSLQSVIKNQFSSIAQSVGELVPQSFKDGHVSFPATPSLAKVDHGAYTPVFTRSDSDVSEVFFSARSALKIDEAEDSTGDSTGKSTVDDLSRHPSETASLLSAFHDSDGMNDDEAASFSSQTLNPKVLLSKLSRFIEQSFVSEEEKDALGHHYSVMNYHKTDYPRRSSSIRSLTLSGLGAGFVQRLKPVVMVGYSYPNMSVMALAAGVTGLDYARNYNVWLYGSALAATSPLWGALTHGVLSNTALYFLVTRGVQNLVNLVNEGKVPDNVLEALIQRDIKFDGFLNGFVQGLDESDLKTGRPVFGRQATSLVFDSCLDKPAIRSMWQASTGCLRGATAQAFSRKVQGAGQRLKNLVPTKLQQWGQATQMGLNQGMQKLTQTVKGVPENLHNVATEAYEVTLDKHSDAILSGFVMLGALSMLLWLTNNAFASSACGTLVGGLLPVANDALQDKMDRVVDGHHRSMSGDSFVSASAPEAPEEQIPEENNPRPFTSRQVAFKDMKYRTIVNFIEESNEENESVVYGNKKKKSCSVASFAKLVMNHSEALAWLPNQFGQNHSMMALALGGAGMAWLTYGLSQDSPACQFASLLLARVSLGLLNGAASTYENYAQVHENVQAGFDRAVKRDSLQSNASAQSTAAAERRGGLETLGAVIPNNVRYHDRRERRRQREVREHLKANRNVPVNQARGWLDPNWRRNSRSQQSFASDYAVL